MTAAQPFGESGPHARLSLTRDLARRVRLRQRATWFPPLVFAIVTYVAIPVTRTGHAIGGICTSSGAGAPPGVVVCVAHNSAAFIYWSVALVVAYVVIAAFYLWFSRTRGVG